MNTCPNCGYCPHCGRGGYWPRPYYWQQSPYYTMGGLSNAQSIMSNGSDWMAAMQKFQGNTTGGQ